MTKLQKAVEQTVDRYEEFATGEDIIMCGFCRVYNNSCEVCPVFLLDGYCDTEDTELGREIDSARGHDIESCLAIMVYVWGFINFGEDFNK